MSAEQPVRYVVGTDQALTLQSKALGAGRQRPPQLAPAPPLHAVPEGSTIAVCGYRPVRVWDQVTWRQGLYSSADFCEGCTGTAG